MDKKNTVFLTIIAVATLLVAVVGATFAYFSTTVVGNDTASQVYVQTATLGIKYTNGQNLVLGTDTAGVVPGVSETINFEIENTGQVAMKYDIKWANIVNTFCQYADLADESSSVCGSSSDTDVSNELVYTLTSSESGVTKTKVVMPTGPTTIESSIDIAAGDTHNYTLTVYFENTGSAQNYNQGKSFTGKIEVSAQAVSSS